MFADTSFFVAFLNADDLDHAAAYDYMANHEGQIVTTDWVLTELGNYLSRRKNRAHFQPFICDFTEDPRVVIDPATHESFERAVELYGNRPDKTWSVTDCLSFLLMNRRQLTRALTSDHHFEQAGFTILLGDSSRLP
ncbi:MAG TPA: PIN domain-containing protein [Pirellulales bacterium]|nr:PIN domain-containing protein [Pirellulales bacterium]